MARGIVLALAALVVAALLSWHAAKVAVQTILLLPALFPSPPLDPLTVFTGAPTHETTTLQYAAGNIQVDLFRPTDSGRHGAIMLLLGAGPIDRLDLADRFAEALARTGIVVMLPPRRDGASTRSKNDASPQGTR